MVLTSLCLGWDVKSGFRDRCTKWMRIQLFYKLTPIFSQVFFLLYEYLFIDICLWTIAKNGVYITLVRDVRHAFEGSPLVKIDCKGMHASDYKKLGAKLKVCNHLLFINYSSLYQYRDKVIAPFHDRSWFPACCCPLTMNRYWCGGDQIGNQCTEISLYLQIRWMTLYLIWIVQVCIRGELDYFI